MTVGCLIPAAGRGERLGGSTPKALRLLAGVTLLEHSIRALASAREVRNIVVAAPADHRGQVEQVVNGIQVDVSAQLSVVVGGTSRTDSVRSGLDALPPECTTILVHDAARPLVPVEVVARVITACTSGATAVVPVLPVVDTIKRVDAAGRVVATDDREELRAAQTPQGFDSATLRAALDAATDAATDDAGLVERNGGSVLAVPGHADALKITRPIDLLTAESIIRRRHTGQTG